MRTHHRILALAAAVFALARSADAQSDTAAAQITGVVYDSVARAPVPGADVQLVATQPGVSFATTVIADRDGRYTIPNVPPGQYVIGFDADALDSLALVPQLRQLLVRPGDRLTIDLAVPSPRTVVVAMCGTTLSDSDGVLLGVVRDARTGARLDSGTVTASWSEFTISAAGLHRDQLAPSVEIKPNGWYAFCGLPTGTALSVIASRGTDSSGATVITIPSDRLLHRDLALGGVVTVRGVVRSDEGVPIPRAHLVVTGTQRAAITDSAGRFLLEQIRAGTAMLETRALGFVPSYERLELRSGSDTTVAITLTDTRHVLDTIRVSGDRVYNLDSNGFDRRRRISGAGFFIAADDISRLHLKDAYGALTRAPALRLSQPNSGFGGARRRILMHGGPAGNGGTCIPAMYLDNTLMPDSWVGDIESFVQVDEIAGVEVYRAGEAPPQFVPPGGWTCGSIVIWTRRPPRTVKP